MPVLVPVPVEAFVEPTDRDRLAPSTDRPTGPTASTGTLPGSSPGPCGSIYTSIGALFLSASVGCRGLSWPR